MSLNSGTRFGTYEVAECIGVGGMGEVYRARDSRLGRAVALKVLPEDRHLDAEAQQRFEREARLLAALNHPNIATLHGIESAGGSQALVMELVDGETLADRIRRTPHGMSPGAAIEIAQQIAAALDAAHERGIVHRDLKPSNIKIRPDGTVKVLDFGIAKALAVEDRASPIGTLTQLPGAIAGTPSYMSPEQAAGGTVDGRTDIWAFGCVLYEMLTGRVAFDGDTSSQILARVLERDPEWDALPPGVSPSLRTLLGQCLQKEPRRRRRDAGDLKLDLERVASTPDSGGVVNRAAPGLRWLAGLAALMTAAIVAAAYWYSPDDARPQLLLEISTPVSRAPHQFAVSPNGRYVVYVASASPTGTVQRLYRRALDTGETVAIPNTEGAKYPFWSPDSRSIAYFDTENLYRIDVNGGPPQRLATAQNALGGSWGSDGTILFSPNTVSSLHRVSASGGTHTDATKLDPQQSNHRFPSFLPDGRHFLYYADGGADVTGIYLGSLDDGTGRRLAAADSAAVSLAPDWVVFEQNDALVARRLDLSRGELSGDPLTIAAPMHALQTRFLAFSASATGILAFRDAAEPGAVLVTLDSGGNVLATGPLLNGPDVSADDRLVAYDTTVNANRDVYIRDLERGGPNRITTDPAVEGYPILSQDGREVLYEKQRPDDQRFEIWRASVNRTGAEQRVYGTTDNLIPLDWSIDGYLLYRRSDADYLSSDLLALPLSSDDPIPIVVADSTFEERMGAFSPDGRWVVYDTARSGRFEIVVQSFPERGEEFRVSIDGGLAPLWSADGTEIYFVARDGTMMAARVTTSGSGSGFAAEQPKALFPTQLRDQPYNQQYAVTSDRRFLVSSLTVEEFPAPISVILNWRP